MVKSSRARRARKPEKPRPDFPLFPHATKRWAKKIKGKLWYFGSWADGPQAALERYANEKDDIFAGRDPRAVKPEGYTLGKLCNEYLNAKKNSMELGKITPRHFRDLHEACARLIDFFGAGRIVEDIGPDDFERLGFSFPKTWRLRRRKREIGLARSVFTYALTKERITRTRFGTFKQPSADELAAERFGNERKHGGREFTPEQLRQIIDAAPLTLRAMIYLAVNCGYGNSDLAALTTAYLDLEKGWATFPRVKTSVERRACLWPETIAAVKAAVAMRPEPIDPEDANLVFVSVTGLRWVRCIVGKDEAGDVTVAADDGIQKSFRMLLNSLEIKRRGLSFYSLRHCCEGRGGADQVAIDRVMGHKTPGMGTNYRNHQSIADDRLRAVSASIHAWLFGEST